MGQTPVRRIDNDPKGGEGEVEGRSDSRRNMGFHIGGERAGSQMQSALGRLIGDWRIDPGEINQGGAAKRFGEAARPGGIAQETLAVSGDDRIGDKPGAGRKAGQKSAGDAETDDPASAASGLSLQSARKRCAVAAAGNRENAGAGGKPRLRFEPSRGDDERAFRLRPGYIPSRSSGRLPVFRLR